MSDEQLPNCICGASVEVDYSYCWEYRSRGWQSVRVGCLGDGCMRGVSVMYEADNENEREAAAKLVVKMWTEFIEGCK